jgi:predicted O-methyltransferase YrrM
VNEDHHLSAAYDLVRPRLLADEPGAKKIPFACWRDRATTLTSLSSVCYALIRVLRPAHIVETGVWFGASTALMLAALHKNRHGRLTSIDLPGFADMSGNASGFDHPFIPDVYKDRWDLRVADATVELPRVFINERPDMFMHDSDHSYQHMVFEFSIAAKYLAKQSVLISDDVRRNSAFYDVMSQVKATVFNHVQNPNIGVAIL